MDSKNKLQRLKFFMKENKLPILVDFDVLDSFNDAIVIEGNITKNDLYGIYVNGEYFEPKWYTNLKKVDSKNRVLIINNLSLCSKQEQKKFIPILKDKEYNNFKLLKDTIILVINKGSMELIDNEVLSYLIRI